MSTKQRLYAAYEDGFRVGRKGLGITKTGRYDFAHHERLFRRHTFRADPYGELREQWDNGWHDGLEDRQQRAAGVNPDGSPHGGGLHA